MNEYLNNIINNLNSTPKQVTLVKEWLELGNTTGDKFDCGDVPQILSPNWEQEILSQSL